MRKFFRIWFTSPLLIIITVLIVGLAVATLYFYNKSKSNPAVGNSQEEVVRLVRDIGKIMILPEGETPTVATVSDPEQLKNQPFFVDAQKGHKVLIYTNARKAVLYDPISKKIVNVAPISIGANTPGTTTE